MRILHLDTGRTWRGGQAQVLHLLRGLEVREHAVRLLAPEGPLLERARSEGFEVRRWRPFTEWDPLATLSASAAIREFRAELVHCHSAHAHAPGAVASALSNVACVVSRRVDFEIGANPFSRLKYRLPVDRYFCISRGVRDVLLRGGVPESRLALVPSGVPLPDPAAIAGRARQRPALRLELGLPSECRVIGTVAALAPHKNHADLLEAAARVVRVRPEVHFVWVGEGECRAALERRRRELALERHVHLLGFRDDVLELLQQFTLFALSSYLEGLCTSLLDAQALGIPIVATAVGGIPDVVENGVTGRLVPGRDPEAFANALLEALDHPEQAAERAERARETVRAFRVEALAERSVQEYHAVLRDRAARAGAR